MFERITFFDVETPNRYNHRMCSIGIVHWVNGQQVLAKEWLVQPDCDFDSFNVRLHGISPQMVVKSPNFKEVWPEISGYFDNTLVVAHNAAFDVGVLTKVLEAYAIAPPSFHYACTVQMAKRRLPKQPFNLAALSQSLNVLLSKHHNALADTLACEGIFRHLVGFKPLKPVDYKAYGNPDTQKVAVTVTGKRVGSRGMLFSFDHIGMATTVYAINGIDVIYIIDTYLGPEIMEAIDQALHKAFGLKPKVIVNTHHDWDHIWGNCRYRDSMIVGHELCKEKILSEGPKQLEAYGVQKQLAMGRVVIEPPNVTFTEKITFEKDKLTLWHTPGHTADSISLWDAVDRVLVAGDNLERPCPVMQWNRIDLYENSLKDYLKLPIQFVITGHTDVETIGLIEENLNWLKQRHESENV